MRGVCGGDANQLRWSRLPRIAIAAVGLAACANEASPDPGAASLEPPTWERCEGPRPIEILAADVAIVIDRSASTRQPTGVDIDGDGLVGEYRHSEYTDRDDSFLAAQIVAVERLVDVARLGGMRFAIISYSGRDDFPLDDSVTQRVYREDARLEVALTDDVTALENGITQVWQRGSDGASSFAPAMRLAVRTLNAGESESLTRRRRIFFLADSATPLRFVPADRIVRDDPRMGLEAQRAIEAGISFHTFALGAAANGHNDEDRQALAQIAGATGGVYRTVPDPTTLYCQMLAALRVSEPH